MNLFTRGTEYKVYILGAYTLRGLYLGGKVYILGDLYFFLGGGLIFLGVIFWEGYIFRGSKRQIFFTFCQFTTFLLLIYTLQKYVLKGESNKNVCLTEKISQNAIYIALCSFFKTCLLFEIFGPKLSGCPSSWIFTDMQKRHNRGPATFLFLRCVCFNGNKKQRINFVEL